jgi:hypothetical protein
LIWHIGANCLAKAGNEITELIIEGMNKYFIVILMSLAACSQNPAIDKPFVNRVPEKDSLVASILGDWGGENGLPVWKISKDSIYYCEEKIAYPYMVHKKNVIVMYRNEPFLMAGIHVHGDTLSFVNGTGGVVHVLRK